MNHVDNPFNSPSVLSLCTGMRGLERGLERAIGSVRVAAYVEIEAFIIYNLVRQMEQGLVAPAPVWTNVKTFPAEQFYRKIHWIIGGYPCQPFSVAGKQQGTEDPRHLWPYIKGAIKLIQPFGCFFENVPNHLNIGYREVRQDLEELGYTVKEGLYTAEEVGAPHERKRLFILALDYSYGCESGEGRRDFTKMPGIQEREWAEFGTSLFAGTGIELADSESKRTLPGGQECTVNRRHWEQLEGSKPGSDVINLSEELAHSNDAGLQGWNSGELSECAEQLPLGTGDTQAWPAGQGDYQHEWEEPRTVEPGLGVYAYGNEAEIDILLLKYKNDKYQTKKVLSVLWGSIETEEVFKQHRRPGSFLKEKVLFDVLLSRTAPRNLLFYFIQQEKSWNSEERELFKMRNEKESYSSSQRRESIKQCAKEFRYAMLILSYQIALATGKERPREEIYWTMQNMWDHRYSKVKYVPEALSENEEIWRSEFNQEESRKAFFSACSEYMIELCPGNFREDLLRMYGNGVVEQTAGLAFIDLLNKHIKD